MGVLCIKLRNSTERPETIALGTNKLVGTNPDNLSPYIDRLFAAEWKKGSIPPLWDGKAAERIVDHIQELV